MMMRIIYNITLCLVLNSSFAQMRGEDRARIREAMDIAREYDDQIWEGLGNVPFIILLVTDSLEYLINHQNPTEDFQLLSYDSLLNSKVYIRKTQFDKRLLATFPAINGVNCIVVGTPENTGKNSTDWIITLLHEHFHQYQYSSPGYYESVNNLKLSGDDQTGMWMLNYPFPYTDENAVEQFKRYTTALAQALEDIGTERFENSLDTYLDERRGFQDLLAPEDYRYFSFQVWQEGIARYTEYKFLEMLDSHQPAREVLDLPDFIPYAEYKGSFYQTQLEQLKSPDLSGKERVSFYVLGFGEGLLLDQLNPGWRKGYLSDKFYLENYSEGF
jgi:hypothetical protein